MRGSGLGPSRLPQPQRRTRRARGALPRPGPSPALTSPVLRAPGSAVRVCGAEGGYMVRGGRQGRPRSHPPRAAPGAGMAAALPAVRGAQGEGKGNEVNRILRQEAFQGLPSAAAPRSYPQPAPEPRLRPPPSPVSGRAQRRAPVLPVLPLLPVLPRLGINKCSPRLRRGRARLSRLGAEGSGPGPGSSTVSWSPALQRAPSPCVCHRQHGARHCSEPRARVNATGSPEPGRECHRQHRPPAAPHGPCPAGLTAARGFLLTPV